MEDNQLILSLSSTQAGVYAVFLVLTLYKLLSSAGPSGFLKTYYGLILFNCVIYISINAYEIAMSVRGSRPNLMVMTFINVYAMVVESCLIFMVSFYWQQTEMLIESHNQHKQPKSYTTHAALLGSWAAIYTCFFLYAAVTDGFEQPILKDIVLYGCQGVSALLIVAALISQFRSGYRFSKVLNRLRTLISESISKTRFRCLYWFTSICNLTRVCCLVLTTVYIQVQSFSYWSGWLAIYLYTFSATLYLVVYLVGFANTSKGTMVVQETFISPQKSASSNRRSSSRHETELSKMSSLEKEELSQN